MGEQKQKVLILGDWDADGVVATALLTYSQEYAKKYPVQGNVDLVKMPIDPDRIKYILSQIKESYNIVYFLDIPYSEILGNITKLMKTHFGVNRTVFVDHHIASVQKINDLKNIFDEVIVDYRKPTSVLIYEELIKHNVPIHPKLKEFVEVIKYMDAGKRIPSRLMKLFEIAKMISKALTAVRSEELWLKTINWLADPTPVPMPLTESTWSTVKKAIEERDKEVTEVAMQLAVAAVKVGDFRFIDARHVWKKRGATALASKLSLVLKAPVVMLAGTNRGYALLIIKASGGRAYRVAKYLLAEGIALDIAGHPNLAIVRVAKDIDKKNLIDALYNALYYAS
ncbi:MAG: phosphoesterase [Desulfurococcaceae archaeon]